LPGQGAAEQATYVWFIGAERIWCSVASVADRRVAGGELLINEARRVQACKKRLHDETERKEMHHGLSARPCAIASHERESTAIAAPSQRLRCFSV